MDFMRNTLIPLLAASLAACATHSDVSVNSSIGAGMPAPGSSVSGARLGVDVLGGSGIGAVIALTGIVWAIHGTRGDATASRHVAPFAASGAAPLLDETRTVREHDCTRPLEDFSANLRCR